jgi:type IV pilus assembly protein PilF
MRIAVALLLVALCGCVSNTTVETRPVTDTALADARRRAEVHTSLAGEYYARGNHKVALDETRAALKDDPGYFPAYNMQALIYMELREDVLARDGFNQALRMSPDNPEVLNNFGWFLCTRNDSARGLEMMQRAANNPLYATPEKALLSVGLCQKRMGRNADAEESLRRAVAIRPDLIGALYNLAILTYDRGAIVDAENYLVRYMRLSAPTAEALALGVRIARAKKEAAAEDSFMQQLRRRYPDSIELRDLEASK